MQRVEHGPKREHAERNEREDRDPGDEGANVDRWWLRRAGHGSWQCGRFTLRGRFGGHGIPSFFDFQLFGWNSRPPHDNLQLNSWI